jgi:hypothetical protein
MAAASPFNVESGAFKRADELFCSKPGGAVSYGDSLNANQFHGFGGIAIFEAKLDYFAYALYQRVQIFRLGVAAAQFGHRANIEAIFVALNNHRKFTFCLHAGLR